MNKIKKYVENIFSTFGLLTPLIIVSLTYVIFISIDRNNSIISLFDNHKGWFYTLAIVLALCIIASLIILFKNLKKSRVNVGDLIIFILFVLALLLVIPFAFNLGKDSTAIVIIKWVSVGVFIVCTFILGILRSKNIR